MWIDMHDTKDTKQHTHYMRAPNVPFINYRGGGEEN